MSNRSMHLLKMALRFVSWCFVFLFGVLPGAVMAVLAGISMLMGLLGVMIEWFLLGLGGLLGYTSGLIILFRYRYLTPQGRRYASIGICMGELAMIAFLIMIFPAETTTADVAQGPLITTLLFVVGPIISGGFLLLELLLIEQWGVSILGLRPIPPRLPAQIAP